MKISGKALYLICPLGAILLLFGLEFSKGDRLAGYLDAPLPHLFSYCFGIALEGAVIGLVIAWVINRSAKSKVTEDEKAKL